MCAVELIVVKVWRIFPCTARVWSSKVKKNINIDLKHLIENHIYHRGFAPHVRYVSYLQICLSHSCRALIRQLTILSSAVSHPSGFLPLYFAYKSWIIAKLTLLNYRLLVFGWCVRNRREGKGWLSILFFTCIACRLTINNLKKACKAGGL